MNLLTSALLEPAVEDPGLCAACGGECCESSPGIMLPSDIKGGVTVESLLALFRTGNYSVDYWEGGIERNGRELPGYFLHPKALRKVYNAEYRFSCDALYHDVLEVPPLVDGSWGGRCILLGPGGCDLPIEERPFDCRALAPRPTNECTHDHLGLGQSIKSFAVDAWAPFTDMIEQAMEIYWKEGGL